MRFSLAIYAPPYSSQASNSAFRFATEAVRQGHQIYRIFFYSDGVYNASDLHIPPQDEPNLPQRWARLANDHAIDVVVCVAAALRRGILDNQEAERYEKSVSNIQSEFTLSGLGQLVDATVHSDRLITFA